MRTFLSKRDQASDSAVRLALWNIGIERVYDNDTAVINRSKSLK
jgi:hypothetical protein